MSGGVAGVAHNARPYADSDNRTTRGIHLRRNRRDDERSNEVSEAIGLQRPFHGRLRAGGARRSIPCGLQSMPAGKPRRYCAAGRCPRVAIVSRADTRPLPLPARWAIGPVALKRFSLATGVSRPIMKRQDVS